MRRSEQVEMAAGPRAELLAEAERLLAEAFDLLAEAMPPAVASAIACQVIEDQALRRCTDEVH